MPQVMVIYVVSRPNPLHNVVDRKIGTSRVCMIKEARATLANDN